MKLTPEQQARIGKCVDLLLDEKTGMDKGQIYGFCTNLEKQGKLRGDGHWGKTDMEEREIIDALKFESYAEIKGFPIFQAGTYHGGKSSYNDADIDSMAADFDATKSDFKRPIKLTHKDSQNEQTAALGVIDRVYTGIRNGVKTLFADVVDVPGKLVQAIKDRRILGHSVEIYPQYKDKKNVLRALAFLGDDVPEVKGLGDLKSYVYGSDDPHISIQFEERIIAAPQGAGDDKSKAASQEDGNHSTNHQSQKKQEAKVEFCKLTMPDGSVRTFATEDEFKVYHNAQIEAAKTGTVPKAQFDALQAQVESNAQTAFFSEIETDLKSLAIPNDSKKALPPFVQEKLSGILKSIPRTLQFGEKGKEQNPAKAIIALFAEVGRVGLVDFSEVAPSGNNKPINDIDKWTADAKAEFAEIPADHRATGEAAYIAAYIDFKKSEVTK